MTFLEKMERLRERAHAMHVRLPAPYPSVVLFLAVSDGAARAHVVHAAAASFEEAWELLAARADALIRKHGLAGRWVRLDWVNEAKATSWGELETQLGTVKRNYFRQCLALDAAFDTAFLEQELNANAMLYGGNTIVHAVINKGNFLTYARRRFGADIAVDFSPERSIHRFRTAGLFCDEDGRLYELHTSQRNEGRRGISSLTADDLHALVAAGSSFLARQVGPDGRFVYGYHPCFDREIGAYNTLRHASTTYSMIEAWHVTKDAQLKAAIERALAHLTGELIRPVVLPDGTEAAFLVDVGGEIKLGGNAVAILALCKYCEVTGSRHYLPLAEKLATGIGAMQRQDTGAFVHVLAFPALTIKAAFRTVYYDGEAAFALMRLYSLTRDARWIGIVERAFEYFIAQEHWRYHDHWLSYCVNELTRYRPQERYFRFGIRNFADYLDFVRKRVTTFPTLLELMMAARDMLSRLSDMPELRHLLDLVDLSKFDEALEFRAHYVLNGHFWPEMAMFFRNPQRIAGSFFIRHHAFRVRIDDVEHYLSGLIAYRAYLPQRPAFRELVATQQRSTADAREPASDAATHWTAASVAEATGGTWLSPPPPGWTASGLCIHTPTMQPGNLVAVRSPQGGKGVPPAQIRSLDRPAGFIVSEPVAGLPDGVPVLQVADMGEAILALGRYARSRISAPVVAVTGSAGKSTAVAMIADVLSGWGRTAQTAHGANLPHGVAWNLASTDRSVSHLVLEVAIGRMAVSARMARPDVAVFTNILPAHLGAESTIADIARTKAMMFRGMAPGTTVVLNRDMLEWEQVHSAAQKAGLNVLQYGTTEDSEFRLVDYDPTQQMVLARIQGSEFRYRVGAAGRHMAMNSLAALAAVSALGYDWKQALGRIAAFSELPGRGEKLQLRLDGRRITVIDDAYNANPGSMKAALERLSGEDGATRRVAVLGQMEELGPAAPGYHAQLADIVNRGAIDVVHVIGAHYAGFWEQIPQARRGCYAASLDEMKSVLRDQLRDGDAVLFKGSHSTRVHELVEWIKQAAAQPERSPGAQTAPAPSVLLYDCAQRRTVYAARESALHPPASLTKLMTLCLIDERLDELGLSGREKIRIPAGAERIDSWWGFPGGEAFEIETLMRASAIVSANEAALALAEWHSGSVALFTEAINARARELGMRDTRFATPAGFGRLQQITAQDALTLALHVLDRHPRIAAFCAERSFSWGGKTRPNTNRLLASFPGAIGLKTGRLRGRGCNLAFAAERDGRRWIAIVLGAPTMGDCEAMVRQMLETHAFPARAAELADA